MQYVYKQLGEGRDVALFWISWYNVLPQVIANISHISYLNSSSDGETVSTAPSSNYDHMDTSLGRVQNTPIVVGSGSYKSTPNKKVEALERGRWSELANFPFVDTHISHYSMVTFEDSLYLFGKFCFFSQTELTIYSRWFYHSR